MGGGEPAAPSVNRFPDAGAALLPAFCPIVLGACGPVVGPTGQVWRAADGQGDAARSTRCARAGGRGGGSTGATAPGAGILVGRPDRRRESAVTLARSPLVPKVQFRGGVFVIGRVRSAMARTRPRILGSRKIPTPVTSSCRYRRAAYRARLQLHDSTGHLTGIGGGHRPEVHNSISTAASRNGAAVEAVAYRRSSAEQVGRPPPATPMAWPQPGSQTIREPQPDHGIGLSVHEGGPYVVAGNGSAAAGPGIGVIPSSPGSLSTDRWRARIERLVVVAGRRAPSRSNQRTATT